MTLVVVQAGVDGDLRGRQGVARTRSRGREALRHAAELASHGPLPFRVSGAGAPLAVETPDGRWYWSLANTRGRVVAAVSSAPVGVDVESLDRPRIAPARAFCDEAELRLIGNADPARTLALWTAKEAVLKKAGCGIAELRECRVARRPRPARVVLEHRGRLHRVTLLRVERHVVAVASDLDPRAVEIAEVPR